MIDERLAVCALAAIGLHLAARRALEELPQRTNSPEVVRIAVHVQPAPAPPAPPPPPPPPPPPEPVPTPIVHEPVVTPRAQPVAPVEHPAVVDQPSPATSDTTTTPVFGVTMESTSQASGPAVPVGNTLQPAPASDAPAKPLAAPVAAALVTMMPVPQGRCSGRYTDAARAAGAEGVVVLDLVVDEHGRARDITVTTGLDYGLTDAAIAALAACTFTPGEKDGAPVAVRVRGFKIRFVLGDE